MVVDSARSSSIPARVDTGVKRPEDRVCGASMAREWIACGAVNPTSERHHTHIVSCAACHRGHICRGWGSRGHTLRGDITMSVTHCALR